MGPHGLQVCTGSIRFLRCEGYSPLTVNIQKALFIDPRVAFRLTLSAYAQEIKYLESTAHGNTMMMYMIIPILQIRKLRLRDAQDTPSFTWVSGRAKLRT